MWVGDGYGGVVDRTSERKQTREGGTAAGVQRNNALSLAEGGERVFANGRGEGESDATRTVGRRRCGEGAQERRSDPGKRERAT